MLSLLYKKDEDDQFDYMHMCVYVYVFVFLYMCGPILDIISCEDSFTCEDILPGPHKENTKMRCVCVCVCVCVYVCVFGCQGRSDFLVGKGFLKHILK